MSGGLSLDGETGEGRLTPETRDHRFACDSELGRTEHPDQHSSPIFSAHSFWVMNIVT